nr:helix-turn-helix domain-containing protein [Planctomycetota bacterium]
LTMTEEAKDLRSAVEDFERDFIRRTLARCDGNRERAADSLGLSQATLYRRLEKLGLKNLG